MPIQHAVLALLAAGASHGYELKSRFEQAIGPQWGKLNIGHLYQVTDRLERDGLVAATRVAQTDRPDKTSYELTEAGREELAAWIRTPWQRQSGYRDELFLRLLAGSRLGTKALKTVVAGQRQVYLQELADLAELKRDHTDDPVVSLLIDAASLHTKADLSIVEQAELRLADLASATGRRPADSSRTKSDSRGARRATG